MTRQMAAAILILGAGWVFVTPGRAQEPGERGPRRSRARFGFTPDDRERMYERVAEHYLERFASNYELTNEQREAVRARLEQLKAQQRQYGKLHLEEFQTLREEMGELWRKQRAGEDTNEQRMGEIHDRMRTIWHDSPLMNYERATEVIESLLPAEQVEKGRQRREQRRAEWESRRAEWRVRRGDRGPGGFAGREPWDRYVEDFTRRYQLDESQQATAQSALRTLKQQRDAYRESQKQNFETLHQIEDPEVRRQRYRELNAPIESMFSELRQRLMKLPTSAQIAAAERFQPASRPARSTTSRPARSTSQPADGVSRPGPDQQRPPRRKPGRRAR